MIFIQEDLHAKDYPLAGEDRAWKSLPGAISQRILLFQVRSAQPRLPR
jgi:hypothetical protein